MDPEHVDSSDNNSVAALSEAKSERSTVAHDSPELEENTTSRKRPRLDSGIQSVRALSTEPLAQSTSSISPADSKMDDSTALSKLSINTKITDDVARDSPSGAPTQNGVHSEPSSATTAPTTDEVDIADANISSPEKAVSPCASSGSPVHIEAAEPEDIDGRLSSPEIQIVESDNENVYFSSVLSSFPFSNDFTPAEAARRILKAIKESTIRFHDPVFRDLGVWIRNLLQVLESHPAGAVYFLHENTPLWKDIAKIIDALLDQPLSTGNVNVSFSGMEGLLRSYSSFTRYLVGSDIATMKAHSSAVDLESSPPLLSTHHMHALAKSLDDTQFAQSLRLSFIEPHRLRANIVQSFCQSGGLDNLFEFEMCLLESVHLDRSFEAPLLPAVHLIVATMPIIVPAVSQSFAGWTPQMLAQACFDIFKAVDTRLLVSLEKYGKVLSATYREDLAKSACIILPAISVLDGSFSKQLEALIVKDEAEVDADILSVLWRVKICKTYLTKGNMDLRVIGTHELGQALINVYNAYLHRNNGQIHDNLGQVIPALRRIAKEMADRDILEAVFGVDCHDQIVKNSWSICQFMALTGDYSVPLIDAIWTPFSKGQNSRAATGVMRTLSDLVSLEDHFFSKADRLHLCRKIRTNPPRSLSKEFVSMLDALAKRVAEPAFPEDPEPLLEAFRLLVTLIHLAWKMPKEDRLQICSILSFLAYRSDHECRKVIYAECLTTIRDDRANADATVDCILAITEKDQIQLDFGMLVKDLDLIPVLIDDLQAFNNECQKFSDSLDSEKALEGLRVRVDLLLRLIACRARAIVGENFVKVWTCLIADNALGHKGRDIAWAGLLKHASWKPTRFQQATVDSVFLDLCIVEGLPFLRPEQFTHSLIGFLRQAMIYVEGKNRRHNTTESEAMLTNLVELLWKIVAEAEDESVSDGASGSLVSFYLDGQYRSENATAQKQKDLATLCLSQLEASYGSQTSSRVRTFGRILSLIGKSICHLSQGQPIGSAVKPEQHLAPLVPQVGRQIRLKYRLDREASREVEVGELETRVEFETRLHLLTGVNHFRISIEETPLDLLERPMQTIASLMQTFKESPFITINQIKPSYEDWYSRRAITYPTPTGLLESTIMLQFDVLYGFMAKCDDFGRSTYHFLNLFAPHEGAFLEDLHSAGSEFQCMYAIRLLRFKLKEEALKNDNSAEHLNRGIATLSNFLVGIADLKMVFDSRDGVELLSLAVLTLEEYIRASKISEQPHDGDERKVMAQVLSLLKIAVTSLWQSKLALQCYSLTLDLIAYSKSAWEELQNHADIVQLHCQLFLEAKAPNLGRDIADAMLTKMLRLPEQPHITRDDLVEWYLQVLAQLVGNASVLPNRSEPLFGILYELFQMRYPPANISSSSCDDLLEYAQAWAAFIQEHEFVECVNTANTDPFIHGLASLLRECLWRLSRLPVDLPVGSMHIDILNRLLFPETVSKNGKYYVPVVNLRTRQVLYDLLYLTSKDDKQLAQLTSATNQIVYLNTIGVVPEDLNDMVRSPAGYVGLMNLANTCFMNSLLTQLFMNIPFRKFMLQVPVHPAAPTHKLLREIQKLFGFLQNSRARAYRPEELVSCMTTIDGSAIDPKLQMDVEEFLNCLFDQWEAQMPSIEIRDTFRSFYHGSLLTQTKSKECEHVSQKEEPYSVIQCNVQGLTNLAESLQQFVQGEEMEGANKYKCESCNGRLVDAVRRTCLGDVQDSIIFHLMRFKFDMVTMERTKLNDYFEFPLTIDMGPYKKDSMMNPESVHTPDVFNLVGVLLHSGQAESGHYISYIRERPATVGTPGKWVEFDDDTVSSYEMTGMSERFFGGTWTDQFGELRPKTYSAYMLFYQRATTMNCDASDLITSLKAPVPPWIAEEVESKNNEVMRDVGLLQDLHQDFIIGLLRGLKNAHGPEVMHDRRKAIIQMSCQHLWQVSIRKFFDYGAIAIIDALKEAVGDCVTCSHFTIQNLTAELDDGRHNILYVLSVLTKHAHIRSLVRDFVNEALRCIRDTPELYGLDVQNDVDQTNDCTGGGLGMMLKAVHEVLSDGLDDVLRWDDFFGIICDIARLGQHESAILICLHVLERLFEMVTLPHRKVLKTVDPHLNQLQKIMNRTACELNNLIQALYLLLRCINLSAQFFRPQAQPLSAWADGTLPLNEVEMEMLMAIKESRVCWLETCLSRYDSSQEKPYPKVQTFDISAFIPLLVQHESSLGRNMFVLKTIMDGIWGDFKPIPLGNCFRAGGELCIATQNQEVFDEMHASLAKMDQNIAEYYYAFYESLLQRGGVPLQQYTLRHCDEWAFALLGNHSPLKVRDDTAQLVIKYLVGDSTTQDDTDAIRAWRMEIARKFLHVGRKTIRANGWMLKTTTTSSQFDVLAAVMHYVQVTQITHPTLKKAEDVDVLQDLEGIVLSRFMPDISAPTGPARPRSNRWIAPKTEQVVVGMLGKHVLTRDEAPTTDPAQTGGAVVFGKLGNHSVTRNDPQSAGPPQLLRTVPDTPPLVPTKMTKIWELPDEEQTANTLLEFHNQQATAVDEVEPLPSGESGTQYLHDSDVESGEITEESDVEYMDIDWFQR